MPRDITWKAYEHSHTDKTADWFWAVGIVAVSGALVAVLFQNILFGVLILISATTLALLSSVPPRERTFALTPRGIMIDDALFPYAMLAAFWIQNRETDTPVLIIDAQRFMVPHIISPLDPNVSEQIQIYLEEYLPEKELFEPVAQRLFEFFGF